MYDAQLVEPLSYDKAKTTMGDLEKMIKDVLFSEDESKDRKQCRLWLLDRRQNGTVRPDYLVEFAKNNNKRKYENIYDSYVIPTTIIVDSINNIN